MTETKAVGWHLVEHARMWWAYRGPTPPPEAYVTHGRRTSTNILGPYASRSMAEALLRQRLGRIEWAEDLRQKRRAAQE